ncbi:MAG TPA: hypothetical protein DCL93_03675 [Faecalibacterium sp.]|nr:hypothetical protein [Faecalibacterium sp.]
MRLYKKAAACLLTAAMAISMLTACGGGGTGGNGGGNTPGTLPDPGQIVLPDPSEGGSEGGGAGGGEGTETKPTKTLIDVNSSKLAKFKEKYAGFKEFYVEMQEVDYEDGSVKQSYDGCLAAKDDNVYMKAILSGKNQKQQLVEQLMLKEFDYNNSYLLLRDSKVAVRIEHYKSESDDNISLGTLIANKLPDLMWSTEVKVGPTKYYAEVYNLYSYEYTTCFTADGKPVYQFVRKLNEKQLKSATLYKTIQAGSGTSKGLCEIPTGFKKYSADFRNNTLTDAKGNVFTIETNNKGDVTSVKDNTGKDVSNDFKWVYDLFEMMS